MAASARAGNLIAIRLANVAKRAAHASALLGVVVGAIIMNTLVGTQDVSTTRHDRRQFTLLICLALDFRYTATMPTSLPS